MKKFKLKSNQKFVKIDVKSTLASLFAILVVSIILLLGCENLTNNPTGFDQATANTSLTPKGGSQIKAVQHFIEGKVKAKGNVFGYFYYNHWAHSAYVFAYYITNYGPRYSTMTDYNGNFRITVAHANDYRVYCWVRYYWRLFGNLIYVQQDFGGYEEVTVPSTGDRTGNLGTLTIWADVYYTTFIDPFNSNHWPSWIWNTSVLGKPVEIPEIPVASLPIKHRP